MSKIEVDAIDKQSGSTLTLGGSGTAVTLACGATQTGFGRTGTVNWITTKKTTDFTAVSGEGYFVDTAASGAVTMTLPSSPSAGNIVGVKDYNGNFATANLTIGRNGSPINGANVQDPVIRTAGASIFLVYVDASQGWVATQDDSSTFSAEAFIVATGGTITQCGNCKIHTFTGPGTFAVTTVSSTPADNVISHLIVGGGGGAGSFHGGGGGAGGFREVKSPVTPYTASPLDGYPSAPNRVTISTSPGSYPIVVGAGGVGKKGPTAPGGPVTNTPGSDSTFAGLTSTGGGKGGGDTPGVNQAGATGGSGGGGGNSTSGLSGGAAGGAGNTPSVSPAQGFAGGSGGSDDTTFRGGGGGGGATAVGTNVTPSGPATNTDSVGYGGAGATTSINGTPTARAGGGGGGSTSVSGTGGAGGGGSGGTNPSPTQATAGTANTGGGGGGAGDPASGIAGGGGSGIVIIRYRSQ
jgi:hypothetical protein